MSFFSSTLTNHFHPRLIATLCLVFFTPAWLCLAAQEKEYHLFTDKKAQTIEANLLSISQDKSKATIQRKDGKKFELPILSLSLDDQLFIKNWLIINPLQSNYNLEINFIKHQESTERIEVLNYEFKWITDPTSFEITIKNLSRIQLAGASLEYYVIVEQAVYTNPLPIADQKTYEVKEWWYSHEPTTPVKRRKGKKLTAQKPLWLIHGETKLEDLAYNHTEKIKTQSFPVREISQSTSTTPPRDSILGSIIKITDKDGNLISLHRSSDNKILKQSWESISKMPPGDRSGVPQADPNSQ